MDGNIEQIYEVARRKIGLSDARDLGPISRKDFQRFAVAVGDLNPLYFSEEAARSAGYPTVIAPPLFITSVMGWGAGPSEVDLREDGLAELESFLVPTTGLRVMGGGQHVELHAPVLDGMTVTMHRKLSDVSLKEGRSGLLVLFTIARTFLDNKGDLLVTCRETFIGRGTE